MSQPGQQVVNLPNPPVSHATLQVSTWNRVYLLLTNKSDYYYACFNKLQLNTEIQNFTKISLFHGPDFQGDSQLGVNATSIRSLGP